MVVIVVKVVQVCPTCFVYKRMTHQHNSRTQRHVGSPAPSLNVEYIQITLATLHFVTLPRINMYTPIRNRKPSTSATQAISIVCTLLWYMYASNRLMIRYGNR